jgi:hypothetical protein
MGKILNLLLPAWIRVRVHYFTDSSKKLTEIVNIMSVFHSNIELTHILEVKVKRHTLDQESKEV